MKKLKNALNKIKQDFIEIAYGISPYDRRLRKDAIMLFLGMFIIFGTGGWLHQCRVHQQIQRAEQIKRIESFDGVKETPTKGLKHIKQLKTGHKDFLVVLVGSKCKDCHRVAQPLTKQIKKAQKHGPVVVLDLDQFSDSQMRQLGTVLPSIKINDSYYMPTVARYTHDSDGEIRLVRISNSTHMRGLLPVFDAENDNR